MTDADRDIIISELSRTVTIDGTTVRIQIYRSIQGPKWALEVVSEDGVVRLWNERFETEADALSAFHAAVQENGMSIFLADGDWGTIH